MALQVLNEFDFTGMYFGLLINKMTNFDIGHTLIEFICHCALPYLNHANSDIRKASVLACCNALICEPVKHQLSKHSLQITGEFLNKLLAIAITDSGKTARTPQKVC